MKKVICFVISVAICFSVIGSFSSCNNKIKSDDESTALTTIEINKTSESMTVDNPINRETKSEGNDIGGGILTTRKYRVIYYSVPYQFVLLVGQDKYDEWKTQIADKTTDDLNEMKIKRFVEYFNISREDFDKANLEFAKVLKGDFDIKLMVNPKDYADQEIEEIYNADIIYTFDDEIINNYYLSPEYPFGMSIEYEEAIANGTYETRTTDWIDIEKMEAEIIAKYGEAEIVTEATTSEQTETVTAG